MKIKIYGPDREKLKSYIRRHYPQFEILKKQDPTKPKLDICYGGDGTLLLAERKDPGVPKVGIRNSQICATCRNETRDTILKLIAEKKYTVIKHRKITAIHKKRKITALNDIIIGHFHINTAIRFKVYIDGIQYGGEFLGDGIVAATPVGSTAYYQAITRSNFQEGIGLAFNNSVNAIGHIIVNNDTKIKVVITRGPGRLRYDNDKSLVTLKDGDEVLIRRSNRLARLIRFSGKEKKLNIDVSQNRLPLGYCQTCRKYYREH